MQMDSVVQFVRRRLRSFPSGKMVVYYYEASHVQLLLQLLECEAYFRNQEERPEDFGRFASGQHRIIVATRMDVDIPDIRCIVYSGRPQSLLDYA